MTNHYKDSKDESGHLDITRINQNGRVLFMVQNLPNTPTDSGMHYNTGSLYLDKEESIKLMTMLAEELGVALTFDATANDEGFI